MDTFQTYDLFRLSKYKKRKSQIDFGQYDDFTFFRFNEVDYFNYVLFKDIQKTTFEQLYPIFNSYYLDNKEAIKLIYPVHLKDELSKYIGTGSSKKIACVKRNLNNDFELESDNILHKVTTTEELFIFTEIYLKGFGSNSAIEEVELNFELLKESTQNDLFLIMWEGEIAGICVNFYCKNHVLLAICTIKEEFRNLGLQKKAIHERMLIGCSKGYKIFTSFTYKDSVSHQNMLKSKFYNYATYEESISKPLENLIKTREVLQK